MLSITGNNVLEKYDLQHMFKALKDRLMGKNVVYNIFCSCLFDILNRYHFSIWIKNAGLTYTGKGNCREAV
jgi:hypothetical protein